MSSKHSPDKLSPLPITELIAPPAEEPTEATQTIGYATERDEDVLAEIADMGRALVRLRAAHNCSVFFHAAAANNVVFFKQIYQRFPPQLSFALMTQRNDHAWTPLQAAIVAGATDVVDFWNRTNFPGFYNACAMLDDMTLHKNRLPSARKLAFVLHGAKHTIYRSVRLTGSSDPTPTMYASWNKRIERSVANFWAENAHLVQPAGLYCDGHLGQEADDDFVSGTTNSDGMQSCVVIDKTPAFAKETRD